MIIGFRVLFGKKGLAIKPITTKTAVNPNTAKPIVAKLKTIKPKATMPRLKKTALFNVSMCRTPWVRQPSAVSIVRTIFDPVYSKFA
ncbi:hypothetical protein DKT75_08615 [Leucothrix arctica]|uniref:Uncharacterized protein n=1 Tax=Leucothrix arctica TaxID=1481894 RepID=A0A317CEN5_9GAMM|nr:hypothetical protein DKT75_08615 [Leucothrix arctica]